jgi:hypothetical protein
LREHEPWLKTQKPFRLERNGASFKTKTPAERCRQKRLDTGIRR